MFKSKKKRMDKKYIVLIIIGILIIMLAIISFSVKDKRNLNKIEEVGKDITLFISKIVIYPLNFIGDNIKEYINLKDVYNENEVLKKNLDRYDYIYNQNIELKRQNKEMKELLDIDYTIDEYDYVNASIINRNVGYWYDTVSINKGSKNGIKKDMAVITSKGLIGKVTKVSNYSSDVKLITSSNSNNKISVIINSNDSLFYGVLGGYDSKSDSLLIEGISNTTNIEEGSLIYTSGLNDMLPSGISIGKVKESKKDNYGLSIIVNAKSNNDMNDLLMVSVLKRKESK